MHADKKTDKALTKFACDDKYRTNLYDLYVVTNGTANVTNGHVAAYWATTRENGTYRISTGEPTDMQGADVMHCLPSIGGNRAYKGKIQLPVDAKKARYALVAFDDAVAWICLSQHEQLPAAAKLITAFDGKYLAAVSALLGDEVHIEVTEELGASLFSKAPITDYKQTDLFAIVMSLRER